LLLVSGFLVPPALASPPSTTGRGEVVIADFEGADYGGWNATGDAFGKAPARGTLPGQMAVNGFHGKGLVNSFLGGDEATGTLTSPPFRIERDHLSFLIGGGGFEGETCMNLVVNDKVVRTATGPNRNPGGTERLRWHDWDVRDLAGQTATLVIVDTRTGGWGHINVDQIVQTDEPRQSKPATREMVVERRYLHLPVRTGAPRHRVRLVDAALPSGGPGSILREFEIELDEANPAFWVFVDLQKFQGRTIRIEADELDANPGAKPFATIKQADEVPGASHLYQEARRPQFHFTSRRGWLNDPNGLVWYDGEYHLFYQHNPYGWNWGNMHWGHAVSKDLIHWTELPIALYPPRFGDWAFSGSGLIDSENTAGFVANGEKPPLVVAFTSTGRGECIAFSTDRGRTFREPDGNPVVKHEGRDPKVFWHGPSSRWVMAVYDESRPRRRLIEFHTSTDLKGWTAQGIVDNFFECPDLFELPIDDNPDQRLWVIHAADGQYLVGNFDGRRFTILPGAPTKKHRLWYGNFYAAQSYSNVPDGRRIQIGWGQGIEFPGMPFNQQMTVPCRLTLRTVGEDRDGRPEVRLFAEPVKELESLRKADSRKSWSNLSLDANANPLKAISGDLFEILATIESNGDHKAPVEFNLRGTTLTYDPSAGELRCKNIKAPLAANNGQVKLRILLDRGSIEVFGNDGRVAISVGITPDAQNRSIGVRSIGGPATLKSLEVFELESAWPAHGS
jgi:fructan beta-fructosidase